TIPAVIKQVSNEQALEMTIIENLQREDLNAMEHARAYERLAQEFLMTQEQMELRTGRDRAAIADYLRLLNLPHEVWLHHVESELSFGHAKALMALESPEVLTRVAAKVVEQALSVRRTEELIFSLMHPMERPSEQEKPIDPNVRAAARTLEE